MGHVPGIGPKGPQQPIEPEKELPEKLEPGKPGKQSALMKHLPQILNAICKGIALEVMRKSKIKAQKRMKKK